MLTKCYYWTFLFVMQFLMRFFEERITVPSLIIIRSEETSRSPDEISRRRSVRKIRELTSF